MKGLTELMTLLTCLVAVTGVNLRHQGHQQRELRTSVMCLDLGQRRGLHNMKVVSKKKYYNRFIDSVWADGGNCEVKTTKLKNRLSHPHDFCKNWNKDHVTIRAPEGLRKWLIKEVGATKGNCGDKEDNFVEIFE